MRTDVHSINEQTPHQNLTEGLMMFAAGTSKEFNTGEWATAKPQLIEDLCIDCLMCIPVCPDSAILVKDGKRGDIDYDHCKGCGICVNVCPRNAITMEGVK